MKILNLKQFLNSKPHTLFCKYTPSCFDFPGVFLSRCGERDFVYDELDNLESKGSADTWRILDDATDNGTSFKMDLECSGRDGCYDDDQLFMVYEQKDVEQLIERLKICLNTKPALDHTKIDPSTSSQEKTE